MQNCIVRLVDGDEPVLVEGHGRHGLTDWNAAGYLAGSKAPAKLGVQGRHQAVLMGCKVQLLYTKLQVKFDDPRVLHISSSLDRAKDTRRLALKRAGVVAPTLVESKELDELDFGDATDMPRTDYEGIACPLKDFYTPFPGPGGESLEVGGGRALKVVNIFSQMAPVIETSVGNFRLVFYYYHEFPLKVVIGRRLGRSEDQIVRTKVPNAKPVVIVQRSTEAGFHEWDWEGGAPLP